MKRYFVLFAVIFFLFMLTSCPSLTNNPPAKPYSPEPADGAVNQPKSITLTWECSDPDGDTLTYDIYYGEGNLDSVELNHTQKSYSLSDLKGNTQYEWKIVAKDNKGNSTEGDVWTFTTGNEPPLEPSNPSPQDNANDVSINTALNWTCSDPDGDTLTYDIYFGTNEYPPNYSSDYPSTSFNLNQLKNNTTYYWKIKAKDGNGGETTSPVWSFTTEQEDNNPPNQPSNPSPTDGSNNVSIDTDLSWSCSDPDGDSLVYDVYFGTSDTPPLKASDRSSSNYDPGTLNEGTTYYWKIKAKDGNGGETTSPVWSFTTEGDDNNPPDEPTNPSPADDSNNVSVNTDLSWTCDDPDGDSLVYDVYFGTSDTPALKASDRSSSNYDPGTLNENTTYYWKIKAKDGNGGETTGPVWSFTTENIDFNLEIANLYYLSDDYPDNTGPIYSSPVMDPSADVYIGSQTNLFLLDSADNYNSGYYLITPSSSEIWAGPAVNYDNKKLYVGNKNGDLYTLDTTSESGNWTDLNSYSLLTSPLIYSNYVFIVDYYGTLYVTTENGGFIGSYQITDGYSRVWSDPAICDSSIFIATNDANIYSYDLESLTKNWNKKISNESFYGGMAVDSSNNMYIAGKKIYSLTYNGTIRWTKTLDSRAYTNPVISTNGALYIGTIGGSFYSINIDDGSTNWQKNSLGSVFSSAVIGNDSVLYVAGGCSLFAINKNTGDVLDTLALDNYVESNPILHDNKLFIATESGTFYIINVPSYSIETNSKIWPMFQRDWYHTGSM